VALFRVTPTSQHLASQFVKLADQVHLRYEPCSIFSTDFSSVAIPADVEWVRPLAAGKSSAWSADVNIMFLTAMDDGCHLVTPTRYTILETLVGGHSSLTPMLFIVAVTLTPIASGHEMIASLSACSGTAVLARCIQPAALVRRAFRTVPCQ